MNMFQGLLLTLTLLPGGEEESAHPAKVQPIRNNPDDVAPAILEYPAAECGDVCETHHGKDIADPFRWLEEDSAQTRRWIKEQEGLFQEYVEGHPVHQSIRDRVRELDRAVAPGVPFPCRGNRLLLEKPKGRNQTVMWLEEGSERRALFDPGSNPIVSLQSVSVSPDGRMVAYGGGSYPSTVRLMELPSGRRIPDRIDSASPPRQLVWLPDSSGFLYQRPKTRDEWQNPRGPQVFLHRIGESIEQDTLVFAVDPSSDEVVAPSVSIDGRLLILTLTEGDGVAHRVLTKPMNALDSEPTTLVPSTKGLFVHLGSSEEELWFYTTVDAPRGRVIGIDPEDSSETSWREVIAERDETIAGESLVGGNGMGLYGDHFVLLYIRDGQPLIRLYDLRGILAHQIEHHRVGMIFSNFQGSRHEDKVYYRFSTLVGSEVMELDVTTGTTTTIAHSVVANLDPDEFEGEHVVAENRHGDPLPLMIYYRDGHEPDEDQAAWMYGYGAYGWNAFAWFQPHLVAWVELGGVYVVPAIRGGGEYGAEWHRDGIGRNKPNAIEDFIDAGTYLVENGYCARGQIVADGWSASGSLAAAAVLQEPSLFGVGMIGLPTLDLLRAQQFRAPNRAWTRQFGDVEDPLDFEAMASYSPYHNLKDGTSYPAMLVWAGEQDQGVPPLHSYKFVAAAQRAQSGSAPILLQLLRGTGHSRGLTRSQRVQTDIDQVAFVLRALGR